MYVDNESAKLFDRLHERDRLVQQAHHISDDDPDIDIVSGHMAAEGQQGMLTNVLILAVVGVIGAIVLVL